MARLFSTKELNELFKAKGYITDSFLASKRIANIYVNPSYSHTYYTYICTVGNIKIPGFVAKLPDDLFGLGHNYLTCESIGGIDKILELDKQYGFDNKKEIRIYKYRVYLYVNNKKIKLMDWAD